jgi:hypothetical protein
VGKLIEVRRTEHSKAFQPQFFLSLTMGAMQAGIGPKHFAPERPDRAANGPVLALGRRLEPMFGHSQQFLIADRFAQDGGD